MQSKVIAQTRPGIPAQVTAALWALVIGLIVTLAQIVPSQARAAPESFADLADLVSPSVVNITTSTMVERPSFGVPPGMEGTPFDDFFREFGPPGEGAPAPDLGPQRSQALGSGFVISEDGYIVTNNHVIEGADEIEIEFFSRDRLPAKVIGTDPNTDIALLKVESDEPLPFVSFGDSNKMRVGDWVMAMGNPLGQGFSVSAGIVSARNRELSGTYDDYIQTDAAINRGNSGGPLFNMDGEVIGVNTAILSPNGGSIGIGFSMASNVVTDVVTQLRDFGETRRGWLGVRIQDVSPDVAEAIGLDPAKGALVTEVFDDGPSKAAGIEQGDVILSFDGTEVATTRELVRKVAATAVGKEVPVVIFRDGQTQTLAITLGRREDAENALPASAESVAPDAELLGMTVAVLTDELKGTMGLPDSADGLVVTAVDPSSDAADKDVQVGDIISEAGQQPVATPADLEARITEAREAGRKSLLLLLRRDGNPRFVALTIEE